MLAPDPYPARLFLSGCGDPGVIVLGFWIIVQILNGVMTLGVQVGGVAWLAHVGGFVAGLVMVVLLTGGRRRPRWEDRL